MLIGYGRISKGEDQDDTLQVQALKEAGCTRIYSEAQGDRILSCP
jgi:DNA invertase Pin-like site-specific DNA recombinase